MEHDCRDRKEMLIERYAGKGPVEKIRGKAVRFANSNV